MTTNNKNKKNRAERSGEEDSIPPAPQGDKSTRWCGCPKPRDYPKIDIHGPTCLRRGWTKEPSVGNKGEIPKAAPSGRKLSGSDAPRTITPTHQTFFSHDYSDLLVDKKNVWLAFAKRFDEKYNKG